MALDTYANLQTSVINWLRRPDLTSQIPDFIVLAESDMNRELQTTWQLVKAAGVFDAEFVDLPPRFRQMRGLRLTSGTSRALREITPEQMNKCKAIPQVLSTEPREFTAINGQLELYPIPDQSYAYAMEYQQGFQPLSDDNPTNWILADHPDAYLYGALAAGSAYAKNDERSAGFQQQFMRVLGEIQRALRTSYDRTLRVDPALTRRHRGGSFNYLTGDC